MRTSFARGLRKAWLYAPRDPQLKEPRSRPLCLYGSAAFVLQWTLAFLTASAISVGFLASSLLSNSVFQTAFAIVHGFFTILVFVAALHAALYQRISAGYAVRRIYSMIRFDVRGLMRITGILITCFLCILGVVAFSYPHVIAFYMQVMGLFTERFSVDTAYDFGLMAWSDNWLLCIYVFSAIIAAIGFLLTINALGLWMRQFDVAHWGSPTSVIEGLQTESLKADESLVESSSSGAALACTVAAADSVASSVAGSATSSAPDAPISYAPVSVAFSASSASDSAASCATGAVGTDAVSNGKDRSEMGDSTFTCGVDSGSNADYNANGLASDTPTEVIEGTVKHETDSSEGSAE